MMTCPSNSVLRKILHQQQITAETHYWRSQISTHIAQKILWGNTLWHTSRLSTKLHSSGDNVMPSQHRSTSRLVSHTLCTKVHCSQKLMKYYVTAVNLVCIMYWMDVKLFSLDQCSIIKDIIFILITQKNNFISNEYRSKLYYTSVNIISQYYFYYIILYYIILFYFINQYYVSGISLGICQRPTFQFGAPSDLRCSLHWKCSVHWYKNKLKSKPHYYCVLSK